MLTIKPSYHRLGAFRAIAAAVAAALALGPGAGAAPELVIDGAGDGHGVGMSQEGALGLALRGAGYREILRHYYTGTALGRAPARARVRVLMSGTVRALPLERYVRGVLAAEVPSEWPLAALEAQAVASRTYALTAHAGGRKFDVYADSRSQVYKGPPSETVRTNAAVVATAGQIVTFRGRPAITYFFDSSGGRTENVENAFPGSPPAPWLRGVLDPYDRGPLHHWKLALTFADAGARLRGWVRGSFEGIEVLSRGFSPRIIRAYVLGSKGSTTIAGAQLAARLGLYDTWAYFSVQDGPNVRPEPDLNGARPAASGVNSTRRPP
jgi:SpoIID/LytB domain protein